MGNSNPEIKTNKYIKFVVQLNKVCHLPGENIEGALYLEGNPGLKETQLMNPKALFIITEKHKYKYKKILVMDMSQKMKKLIELYIKNIIYLIIL
jgi:hypothetical protein